jgi:hypothetical protein
MSCVYPLHTQRNKIGENYYVSVGEDVVSEFVALQGEQNLIVSLDVTYRSRIQNSRDKRANVLSSADLHVQHGDDNGVTLEGGGGSALEEEAVVDASCKAAVTTSAGGGRSLFFFEEKGDGADVDASFSGLKGGHLVDDTLL